MKIAGYVWNLKHTTHFLNVSHIKKSWLVQTPSLYQKKKKKKEVYSVLTIALTLRRRRVRKIDNEAYLKIETKCVNNITFVRIIQQILQISVECNGIAKKNKKEVCVLNYYTPRRFRFVASA